MTATNICYNFVGFRCSPPLRYFMHQIPTPEEAGISSKGTEAANKEVRKLQKVT